MIPSKIKVIITGATGLVGEGVLLHCLDNSFVEEILVIGRRAYKMEHPKLKQLVIPDFLKIADYQDDIKGYDACFYCAGISSVGMSEEEYTRITYTTTLVFFRGNPKPKPRPDFLFCEWTKYRCLGKKEGSCGQMLREKQKTRSKKWTLKTSIISGRH